MSTRREMRVFISSTFRDMQQDRDELVKRVFPQLREVCEQRGVAWGEVDLRWGVTDEQRAEGRVLPICLEEIAECRPYFVGLLGERYGWVPDEIPPHLIEREPWLAEHRSCSVTELEIWHGVLNDPAMAERAFFYFRDPGYLDRLPNGAVADDFRSEGAKDVAKLVDLKRAIRASGFPVRDGYRDPHELGSLVLDDLLGVIDRLFPAVDLDPLDREATLHDAIESSLHRVYVGWERYAARLETHLAKDGPPLVVTGPQGAGKSALLAHVARRLREGGMGGGVPRDVIVHYGGAAPRGGGWPGLVTRLAAELDRWAGLAPSPPPADAPALREAFSVALLRAAARGPLALVLDDLDILAEDADVLDLSWLPAELPPGLRCVCSAGPGPVLEALRVRGWPILELEPLVPDERAQIAREWLTFYRKTLAANQLARIAEAEPAACPLYLRILLGELRLLGRHEELDERIDRYLAAGDIPDLLDQVFARYEEDYDPERTGWIREALSLLWAARRGLLEVELRDLLGREGELLPGAIWSPFFVSCRHLLASGSGLLAFGYASVRQAVERRYLRSAEERVRSHGKLGEYFRSRFEIGPLGEQVWEISAAIGRPLRDPRRLEEVPWQLAEAGRWESLRDLLTNPTFFAELKRTKPFDLREYWRRIEAASPLRRLDAYRPVLDRPSEHANMLLGVMGLLREGGHAEEALALAERTGGTLSLWGTEQDRDEAAQLHAILLRDLGRLEEATALLSQREARLRESKDTLQLAHCLRLRGALDLERNAPHDALRAFEEAESIGRSVDAAVVVAHAQLGRASALIALSDLDAAWILLDEAERSVRVLNDPLLLASCLEKRARVSESHGDLQAALEIERECEAIYRRSGDQTSLRAGLQNQAEVQRKRGDAAAALALLEEKEGLCREGGDRIGLARCLSSRAQVLLAEGDLAGAVPALVEQERLWVDLGGDHARLEIFRNIADSLLEVGRPQAVVNVLDWRSIRARDGGDDRMLAELLFLRGSVLAQELGRPHEAEPLLAEAGALLERMGESNLLALVEELRARVDSGADEAAPTPARPVSEEAVRLFEEARTHWERGDDEGAVALLDRCIALEPELAQAFHHRGACRVNTSPAAAVADYSEAIRLEPTHYGHWFMRGLARVDLGHLDEAIADGEQALECDPACADAHLLLALALGARSGKHGVFRGAARKADVARGLDHLEQALQHGYSRWNVVSTHPHLQALRKEARYRQIAERWSPHRQGG